MDRRCLIVSGYGFLSGMYSLSDMTIIGGTFYPLGGHNPLESLANGKITVIGPHHDHIVDMVEDFENI